MIEIRVIDEAHQADIRLPNEPFSLFGRMVPRYADGAWSYSTEKLPQITEMRFPDEAYDYDRMQEDSVFLGAYEDGACVGLAVLQSGFFAYMYLLDLKVSAACRGKGVGKQLLDRACETAHGAGYRGLYTQAQDNNLAACLFYLRCGFRIGGFDSEVYKGSAQEGKADILFYRDL